LDILALDRNGVIVVVELKLEIAQSLADQQAIRYASFCSLITTKEMTSLYADHHDCTTEYAIGQIAKFLEVDELPELTVQPRIILAAGAMNDPELTSCVLWLRKFNIDISCVELTPYRMPKTGEIVIAPRVIIPLPETKEYEVRVALKEQAIVKGKSLVDYSSFWSNLTRVLESMKWPATPEWEWAKDQIYMKGYFDELPDGIAYEFIIRKSRTDVWVQISLQAEASSINQERLDAIEKGVSNSFGKGREFNTYSWVRGWTRAGFNIPFQGRVLSEADARPIAEAMNELVERTLNFLQNL